VDTPSQPASTEICIWSWLAIFGCYGNSEGSGKGLVVCSQAPFTAWGAFCTLSAWGNAMEGCWKIFCLMLLNTTCSSGHLLPKRRQQDWTDTDTKHSWWRWVGSSQGDRTKAAGRSCWGGTSVGSSTATSHGNTEGQTVFHHRWLTKHQMKASSKCEINIKK